MVGKQIDQIVEIVGERCTIFNDNAAILTICEVIFWEISARNKHIIVEYVRFDVMHSKDFS